MPQFDSPFNPSASPCGLRPWCPERETPLVEPSEELRQVVIRFFEALRDGDEESVRNRVSREPGFERLGSDPQEVWHDGETSALLWVQQIREMGGGYPWRLIDEIRAMREGTVGGRWDGRTWHRRSEDRSSSASRPCCTSSTANGGS